MNCFLTIVVIVLAVVGFLTCVSWCLDQAFKLDKAFQERREKKETFEKIVDTYHKDLDYAARRMCRNEDRIYEAEKRISTIETHLKSKHKNFKSQKGWEGEEVV